METIQAKKIGSYRPLLVDSSNRLWVARKYSLFCSTDQGHTFSCVARYRPGFAQQAVASVRLGSRLLRTGFHGLRVLPSGDLVAVIKGGILRLGKGERFFDLVHRFEHGSRPLNICSTPTGNLFYGEYWGNPDRDEVRIFGSFDCGRTWVVAHTFPKSTIRHVHGIHYDRFRNGCWILTGDSNDESQIIFADTRLENIEVVARGSQSCRAVTIIPLRSGLVVPTDTEHELNYIQWLCPETGRLDRIAAIPGTVFYSTATRSRILLSTVVEPSEVNFASEATIWESSDGQEWRQIYAQEKDVWSPVYFQYGTFVLPAYEGSCDFAFAGGQAVRFDDQQLLKFDFGDRQVEHDAPHDGFGWQD